jgi:hypothetical protein
MPETPDVSALRPTQEELWGRRFFIRFIPIPGTQDSPVFVVGEEGLNVHFHQVKIGRECHRVKLTAISLHSTGRSGGL